MDSPPPIVVRLRLAEERYWDDPPVYQARYRAIRATSHQDLLDSMKKETKK